MGLSYRRSTAPLASRRRRNGESPSAATATFRFGLAKPAKPCEARGAWGVRMAAWSAPARASRTPLPPPKLLPLFAPVRPWQDPRYTDSLRPPVCTQSSGVQCDEECLKEFEQMKIRSSYQYMVFKITDDKKSIVIEKKGEKGASFDEFKSALPEGDCRYAVLDVEINTKSGATANKLIFVAWSDDNASVKPKMLCVWPSPRFLRHHARARDRPPGCRRSRSPVRSSPPPLSRTHASVVTLPHHRRLIERRTQEGAHRHQRGVPGDGPRRSGFE